MDTPREMTTIAQELNRIKSTMINSSNIERIHQFWSFSILSQELAERAQLDGLPDIVCQSLIEAALVHASTGIMLTNADGDLTPCCDQHVHTPHWWIICNDPMIMMRCPGIGR